MAEWSVMRFCASAFFRICLADDGHRELCAGFDAGGPSCGDGFGAGPELDGFGAVLVEVAEHRAFPAAEPEVSQGRGNGNIDADHADLAAGGEVAGGIAVAGEDGNAIAILMGIDHGK